MTAAIRKQIERSRQAQDGRKRIEIILDPVAQGDLERVKQALGVGTREAIECALGSFSKGL